MPDEKSRFIANVVTAVSGAVIAASLIGIATFLYTINNTQIANSTLLQQYVPKIDGLIIETEMNKRDIAILRTKQDIFHSISRGVVASKWIWAPSETL